MALELQVTRGGLRIQVCVAAKPTLGPLRSPVQRRLPSRVTRPGSHIQEQSQADVMQPFPLRYRRPGGGGGGLAGFSLPLLEPVAWIQQASPAEIGRLLPQEPQ